jgi:hypothetical protein
MKRRKEACMAEKKSEPKIEYGKWSVTQDKDRSGERVHYIRRWMTVQGRKPTQTRYKGEYDIYASREEIERIARQLNLRDASEIKRAKEAYEWRHTFITESLMESYKEHLTANIVSKGWRESLYKYARKNMNWFIDKCKESDPLEWKRLQARWTMALFCELTGTDADRYRMWDDAIHPDTISKQVQATNRLLEWLHDNYPKNFPSIRLKAYSKSKMKDYRARWKSRVVGRYIPDDHAEVILKHIDAKLKPYVWLQLNFGLRRQEAMAIRPKNIYKDHLLIDEQLVALTDGEAQYDLLKDKESRKVSYWFAKAKEVSEMVRDIDWLMHPDTYSHRFADELVRIQGLHAKELKSFRLDVYCTHDLRRTFCSNAFRAQKIPDEIRLCMGHEDIRTTQKYQFDWRPDTDTGIYNPEEDSDAA